MSIAKGIEQGGVISPPYIPPTTQKNYPQMQNLFGNYKKFI